MIGNDFVKFFLRTPLRIFMGDTMLITVTGHKTGKKYSTPVGFYRGEGCLWVLSSRDRTWWRNVRGGGKVTLLLRGKQVDAFACVEEQESAVELRLVDYIRNIPMAAKPMGIRVDTLSPNQEDVRRVAKEKVFVKIQPEQ